MARVKFLAAGSSLKSGVACRIAMRRANALFAYVIQRRQRPAVKANPLVQFVLNRSTLLQGSPKARVQPTGMQRKVMTLSIHDHGPLRVASRFPVEPKEVVPVSCAY